MGKSSKPKKIKVGKHKVSFENYALGRIIAEAKRRHKKKG